MLLFHNNMDWHYLAQVSEFMAIIDFCCLWGNFISSCAPYNNIIFFGCTFNRKISFTTTILLNRFAATTCKHWIQWPITLLGKNSRIQLESWAPRNRCNYNDIIYSSVYWPRHHQNNHRLEVEGHYQVFCHSTVHFVLRSKGGHPSCSTSQPPATRCGKQLPHLLFTSLPGMVSFLRFFYCSRWCRRSGCFHSIYLRVYRRTANS